MLAIRGLTLADASPCHLITTDLDHNSVLRPFSALCEHPRIKQTRVPIDPISGLVDPNDIRKAITKDTRMIALVHGSNVTGTLQPIREIGQIASEHDIPFIVDAAQTCGHVPIDVEADHIDFLAAPGHKGLLGPLGTGFLYIRPGMEKRLTTIREGAQARSAIWIPNLNFYPTVLSQAAIMPSASSACPPVCSGCWSRP
ncbi:MAG: aminotransferase class V-fold PLP-dependent enzyme [Phycisphaerales bacterium]|nr:aminotransferase class V-fold PLP-dependent enzyme [Phycisphaerales bacterium]